MDNVVDAQSFVQYFNNIIEGGRSVSSETIFELIKSTNFLIAIQHPGNNAIVDMWVDYSTVAHKLLIETRVSLPGYEGWKSEICILRKIYNQFCLIINLSLTHVRN